MFSPTDKAVGQQAQEQPRDIPSSPNKKNVNIQPPIVTSCIPPKIYLHVVGGVAIVCSCPTVCDGLCGMNIKPWITAVGSQEFDM